MSSKNKEKVCKGTEYTPTQKTCKADRDCQGKKSKCIEVFEPIAPREIQNKAEDKTGDGFECGKINEFHFHWYNPNKIKDFKIGHFKIVGGQGKTFYEIFEKRHKFKNDDEKKRYELKRQDNCCDALLDIHGRQKDPNAQGWIFCYNCMAEMWKRPKLCGDFESMCH